MILFLGALTYLNAFWSQLFTELAGNSSHIEMNYQTIFPGNQLSYHFTGLSSHRGWPSDSGIASFAPALSPRPSHILDHLNILASLDRRLARRCPIVLIDRPSPSGEIMVALVRCCARPVLRGEILGKVKSGGIRFVYLYEPWLKWTTHSFEIG